MSKVMKRVSIALLMYMVATAVFSEPPRTLMIGGRLDPAADGTSVSGSVWVVYDANKVIVSGVVDQVSSGVWVEDVGAQIGTNLSVGTDALLALSKNVNAGAITHTGYYAVMNHTFAGRDPVEFGEMTLCQIPIPAVSVCNLAELSWTQAIEDAGDVTNVVGYVVYRGMDGIAFDVVGTTSDTNYTDAIPNDAEYYYSIGLLHRGTPVVTSLAMSANSACVFKDSDMDTLPDYYELANGLDELSGSGTNGPAGDADSDSMSNYEEWIAGTMANSATSYFFAKEITGDGSGMSIEWEGVAQRSYELQRTDQLGSGVWTNIYGPILCTNNQAMQYIDTSASNGVSFYNLIVSKP